MPSVTVPSSDSPSPLAARLAAVRLLDAVLRRKRFVDDAIEDDPGWRDLDDRDRGFARLLCATVLRRLHQCDAWIDACLERPLPPKVTAVRTVLRLGIAQIAFIGTPAHATLATSVDLTRALGFSGYTGLVNAILRRFVREGRDVFAARETSGEAARLNMPGWLLKAWEKAYGNQTGMAVTQASLCEAPLDLSVKSHAGDWAARLNGCVLPGGTVRLNRGKSINNLDGYAEGAWWVQDAAAAIPARLFGSLEGRQAVDLCAAPGGKTAQLAAAGASVTAVDRSARRLRRLSDNLARLSLSATVVEAEVVQWRADQLFDAVLLDAPCSATGTMRRHPELMHLKSEQDCVALARTQAALLRAASEMVKPGGVLVYCVCSLQPEEGEEQIAAALREGISLRRLPVGAEEIGGLSEAITSDGDVRTLPCMMADLGGMDGFFAARLQKI